ncbi:MAG: hypothetical protein ACI82S_003277 [Patiriisocius sp.]|jgi:hypothetical protein
MTTWWQRKQPTPVTYPPLAPEQIQSFNDNGFLIVELNFAPIILDQVVTDMAPKYAVNKSNNTLQPGTRVQDGWKHSNAVHHLATKQNALDYLGQLFGKKAKAFQTLNFPVGTQQKLHSDTIHFNSIPPRNMAGIWVALEDVTMDNGPLVYYPGSHKMPEYNMQDIGLDVGHENYKGYEVFIENKMKESEIEPSYGLMKKGQALIWHANLIHGGSKRRVESSTRHSQVTHYYFEGCKYFTPMMSTQNNIAWRDPQWIPLKKDNFYRRSRKIISRVKSLVIAKI